MRKWKWPIVVFYVFIRKSLYEIPVLFWRIFEADKIGYDLGDFF